MARPPIERQFIVLRWGYYPSTAPDKWSYPCSEDVYTRFDEAAQDVASGEVEPLVQAIRIDLDAGRAEDITRDIENEAAERAEARRERLGMGER